MEKCVFVYIQAYNAEKVLHRSIESILSQTHDDFICWICNNGSNDKTMEIIERYALYDRRIIPFSNERNDIHFLIKRFLPLLLNNYGNDGGWFCNLDADDEYAPDFFKKILVFIEEHNLEVAACGHDFIDAPTNRFLGTRKLEQNLIVEGDGFNEHFPLYHQFMRTVWGKMYSLSVLRRCNFENKKSIIYGSDTLFAVEAFRNASRVGVLAESLHKYYMYPKSVSQQFDDKRIASDPILFDNACDFLLSKCGAVSHENLNFLFHVYLNAIQDTMKVLLNAQLSVTDKLYRLQDIFQSQQTQKLAQWTGGAEEQKKMLFGQVAQWILSQEEVRSGTGMELAAEMLATMGIYPTQIGGWQDSGVFLLLAKIKDRRMEMGIADAQIVSSTSKSPLLAGLDAGFLIFFRDIVFSILQQEEEKALRQIEDKIAQGTDIPVEYIEAFLILGLNLSAKLEYTDDYIYFKKLQISLLIDLSRTDEARDELADWDEILPNDTDFIELRKRLTQ